MKRRDFMALSVLGSMALPSALTASSLSVPGTESIDIETNEVSPFDVGGKCQLFVDQVLVRETQNLSFTLHPGEKHPGNPLVKATLPWEGWRLELYGTVLFDEEEKLFKMWYNGEAPDYFPDYAALYATSKDGITWEKPLVGTIPCRKVAKHNAVANACLLPSVIKDYRDPDPSRRYKMVCWITNIENKFGYHSMTSPDGLHWKLLSKIPIAPGGDVITGYYDEQRGLFVAFVKIMTDVRGHQRRVFYVVTSPDFEHWTQPELAFVPDLRDDAGSLWRIEQVRSILDVPDSKKEMRTEFYGIGTYSHESCTLGFPWVFTINNEARYGNQEGPFELQLGVSRDLVHWERPFRIPCVPRDRDDQWDSGLYVTPSQALKVGDEIWLYYGGSNYTHGTPCLYVDKDRGTKYTGSIGLAKWKLDRFVSVDAPAEGGTLTTVPLVFSGTRLEINALVRNAGGVSVEILDAAGKEIQGYAPSVAFKGDSLRHVVAWDHGRDVSELRSKPISLRFHLRNAELYSFAFRG